MPAINTSNNKQDQKYQKMIYNSISVTEESDNKMSDYDTIHFMGKKPSLH